MILYEENCQYSEQDPKKDAFCCISTYRGHANSATKIATYVLAKSVTILNIYITDRKWFQHRRVLTFQSLSFHATNTNYDGCGLAYCSANSDSLQTL